MIHFNLTCENSHHFDGWFSSSGDFESQIERGLVTCPVCNSGQIKKSLMAPGVATARRKQERQVALANHAREAVVQKMRELHDVVTANADNVGPKFAEEARRIHYGEVPQRGIYGEASRDEVVDLIDEGIEVSPLPVLPEDQN